jgi:hypothetical protein
MWGEHEALMQGLKLTRRGMECHSDSAHISTAQRLCFHSTSFRGSCSEQLINTYFLDAHRHCGLDTVTAERLQVTGRTLSKEAGPTIPSFIRGKV